MQVNELMPIIIYLLLSILIVVLIILGIRLINTLKKVDTLLDDMNHKMETLDGVFDMIDYSTNSLKMISTKVLGFVNKNIRKIFRKRER